MGLTGENGLKTMQYVISVFSAKFTPKPVGFTGKNKRVGFLNSSANCGVFFAIYSAKSSRSGESEARSSKTRLLPP